jgi:hypothetical protein
MTFKFSLKLNFEIFFSFAIAGTAGIILLYYFYHNNDKKIERYFLRHKKGLFVLLQITYFILIITVIFNTRYVISIWMTDLSNSMIKYIKKYNN